MKAHKSVSLPEIKDLSEILAKQLKGGEIFALVGTLGAGKTTFVQAVAKQLQIKRKITSPTFVLLNQYPAKLKTGKKILIYHLDLYRVKNFKEADALGLKEFWGKHDTVTFIEWADKITKYLPKKTKLIKFSGLPTKTLPN